MYFTDTPGLEETKNKLRKSIVDNKIAHAQLFYGKEGCAKLPLAIAYARYLNCEKRENTDSCGYCMSCVKYEKLSHPDLHFVFPTVKKSSTKKSISDNDVVRWREEVSANPYITIEEWIETYGSENKTGKKGMIYKDEAVSIVEKTRLKNYESKYRVFLIWLPELMNLDASNKLLKIIEEPPSGTVFLFVSKQPEKLIATVSSRLQKTKIRNFYLEEIKWFFKDHEKKELNINYLVNLTKGNVGKIKKIINDKTEQLVFFDSFSSWMRLAYKMNVLDLTNWVNSIAQTGRNKQKLFLEYAIKMIRECVLVNFTDPSLISVSEKERQFVLNFSPFVHEKNSISIFEELEGAYRSIGRNANPKIIFFDLSLKIGKCLKVKRKFAQKK